MKAVFPPFVCHRQAVLPSAPLRARRARRRRNCSYLPAGSLNPNTAGVFYQYDPNGNLLWQQTVGGGSTGFLEHETATHYYWLPNEHGDILIGFDQGINSYAVYTDHLNTPRLVTKIENPQNPRAETDTANDLPQAGYGEPQGISPLAIPVWQWSYSPFGADLANGYEAKPTTIANNFKPDLWTWTGLPETGGADPYQVAQETWRVQANLVTPPTLNIRYPGQYYDFEAGLVQNWWRTYEPRIGRYVSADPIGLDGGWNRFAYANQDGINQYDPYGLWAWGDPINQNVVDGTAGFGDGIISTLTFGTLTGTDLRSNLDISDANSCSKFYKGGRVAGTAVTLLANATGAIPKTLTHFTTQAGARGIAQSGIRASGSGLFGGGKYASSIGSFPKNPFVPPGSTIGITIGNTNGYLRTVPGTFLSPTAAGAAQLGAMNAAYGVVANRDMFKQRCGCGNQ